MARWKKITAGIAVFLFGPLLLGMLAAVVLLHSDSFHRYVIQKAEASASDSLNAQVKLRDFKLTLSTLTLDLYDVTIHSSEPDANAPLLRVDHLTASVKITSVMRSKWNLSNIQVDHPVVRLLVDKDGNTNLPKPKPSNSNNTDLFDLAVQRAAINQGEVYYNDRKAVLDANLQDVNFQSSYDSARGDRYYGNLGYKQGNLHFGDYRPVQHDLSTMFDATRSGLTLDPVNFTIGQSHVLLHAAMQNYANPVITAQYDASLDATEFRKILKNASIPAGIVHLVGNGQYRSATNKPMLEAVTVDGSVTSPALLVDEPGLRTEVRAIDGRYKLADGNAELTSFRASVFGGEITATARVKDLAGAENGTLHAVARNISAASLKSLANSASLKDVNVSGRLNASAEAKWSGSMNHLVANADAEIKAAVANRTNGSAQMPLEAVVHAKYAGDSNTIALHQSYVRTPQTTVNLDGTMSNTSNLQIQLRSRDLGEIDTLAALFSPPTKPGQAAPQPLGLRGTATFDGEVHGTIAKPQLTGQLAADNLEAHGTSWRQLRTKVALSPSSAALQNGSLVPASHGRITFDVQVGLKQWTYTPSNPINIAINANQLSVQEIEKAANQSYPATGTLSLNVRVHGTQLNPIGNGSLSLVNAKVGQEPIQSVNLKFNGTGEVVHATLDARIPAGATQGTFAYYPKNQGYEAALKTANLQLGQLQTLRAKNMQITGALSLNVDGKGTFNDPQMQASITIPQLQVKNQVVKGISLQAGVANHVGTFALNSELQNTFVKANGKVNLTGDYTTEASFDTQGIPLQPIFAIYAPAQAPDMTGETELHATVKGPLKNKAAIEAHVSIPVFKATYKELQIAAASPIKIDYANNVLTVQLAEIKGTDTDLKFGGRIPLNSGAPASLNANGNVDLKLAQIFVPDLKSGGQIKFAINSTGSLTSPDVNGKIEIVDADILPLDSPLGLDGGNGVLTLTNDRLQVTKFSGTVGGGQVNATGAVTYKPSLQFNLALSGQGIHFLYENSVRMGADTNLALTGNLDSAYLRGQVQLTRLSFTPDFDLMTFANQLSGTTVSAPSGGFEQNLHLAITVQTTSQLDLVSKGLSLQGNANLRVVGTADNPVILGRANITGGDMILNGNRYILQSGSIEFVNPAETEPVVNLAASTTINEYNINLRLHGPVTQLQTSYNSDPALPPVDIINLIAFGKTTEASAQNTQSASMGAQSLIASSVSSQVTNRVSKIAGISQLSIDPGLGGGGANTGPKIAIQQRVSGNLFVTFASDLGGTSRQQVMVEYHISPKWSVSAIRDQNGGFGFDAKMHKDF